LFYRATGLCLQQCDTGILTCHVTSLITSAMNLLQPYQQHTHTNTQVLSSFPLPFAGPALGFRRPRPPLLPCCSPSRQSQPRSSLHHQQQQGQQHQQQQRPLLTRPHSSKPSSRPDLSPYCTCPDNARGDRHHALASPYGSTLFLRPPGPVPSIAKPHRRQAPLLTASRCVSFV